MARSHLDLNDTGKIFDLRLAVWHHNIDGPPQRTDYMDAEIVQGMVGRGFRLGLYGHQHRTQVTPHHVYLPDRERMAVVSAGSLCAGARDLPTGTYRQYNVLEVPADFTRVRAHVREMAVANLFSRGHLAEFGGLGYADLGWDPPRNQVGGRVNTGLLRARATIEEAEAALKAGEAGHAVTLLRGLDLPAGSYERRLFLSAATEAVDWLAIIEVTDPPCSIEELVQRVEACTHVKDFGHAVDSLDEHAGPLALPAAMEAELRLRIEATQGMQ